MEIRWLWKVLVTVTVILQQLITVEAVNAQESLNDNGLEAAHLLANITKLVLGHSELANTSDSIQIAKPQKHETEEFLDDQSNQPHSRRKRLVWVTDDGRLALPPGTTLTISPSITMPLVRYPPEGFLSNISFSFPVTIDFDKLGLTDNQNPLGDLPPIFARSFGRAAGSLLGNYVSSYLQSRRKRDLGVDLRETENIFLKDNHNSNNKEDARPELPEKYKHVFHGGERALLYVAIEDFLSTFGMNGKGCLLRTICEVHASSLGRYGFFGEILKLFLTASYSPFAEHIPEYVKAQRIGEGKDGPGECFPYYKDCPKGLFKGMHKLRKYSEHHPDEHNEIFDESDIEGEIINNNKKTVKNVSPDIFLM